MLATSPLSSSFLVACVVALGACCSSERAPEPTPVSHEVLTEPHHTAPTPVAAPEPTPVDVDCASRPAKACCLALTPECVRCSEEGAAELKRWEEACAPVAEPLPTSYDCGAPPPLTPCCRALLPKCTQCADRNRAISEAYRVQCGHD